MKRILNSVLSRRTPVGRWLPAVLVMALIFAFSSLPGEVMEKAGLSDFLLRKAGHLTVYLLLGASYARALRPATRRGWLLAGLLALLYAVSDEIHQRFIPGRGGSPFLDVGIDTLGAALGLWLHHRLFPR